MGATKQYLHRVGQAAVDSVAGTGLFPSVILAQAIIESGNGASALASRFNNHFGIKATKSWKGKVVEMNTREVIGGISQMMKQPFRVYDSATDSFRDRNKFLRQNPRYGKNGVFAAKTPEDQAIALQKAGYATDPLYARTLIKIINQFDLKKFDLLAKKNA